MDHNSSTDSKIANLYNSFLFIIGSIQLYYRLFDQHSQHMINGSPYIIQ